MSRTHHLVNGELVAITPAEEQALKANETAEAARVVREGQKPSNEEVLEALMAKEEGDTSKLDAVKLKRGR